MLFKTIAFFGAQLTENVTFGSKHFLGCFVLHSIPSNRNVMVIPRSVSPERKEGEAGRAGFGQALPETCLGTVDKHAEIVAIDLQIAANLVFIFLLEKDFA